MASPLILSIDQGTTSVRATVLGESLAVLGARARTVERAFPRPGWVELDAEEVVRATEQVAAEVVEAVGDGTFAGLGLANQGETVVVWERSSGKPIGPAVVWQCRRTEEVCARLRAEVGVEAWVRELTGLPIDAYFSAAKIAWILDSVPGARARAERGELLAGTLDTFTLFRLTAGRLFVTDPSTSCRTQLAELTSGRFSGRLCDLFRVPARALAEVVPSDASLGPVRLGGRDIELRALLCDQPAALLGTGCLSPGDVKCTYGTGAFLQVNAGPAPAATAGGLLSSIAWELGGSRTYLAEGSVLAAGDVLSWLERDLGLIAGPGEIDALLARTPDARGVLFAPALAGLGAPRWVGDARGTILGLSRAARREHVVRAALEGIAHLVADVLEVAAAARGLPLAPMRADGGLTASDAFLQLQADLAGHPLVRAAQPEATTRGVAAVAALRAGLAASLSELCGGSRSAGARFDPRLDEPARSALRARHRRLLDVLTSTEVLALMGG